MMLKLFLFTISLSCSNAAALSKPKSAQNLRRLESKYLFERVYYLLHPNTFVPELHQLEEEVMLLIFQLKIFSVTKNENKRLHKSLESLDQENEENKERIRELLFEVT